MNQRGVELGMLTQHGKAVLCKHGTRPRYSAVGGWSTRTGKQSLPVAPGMAPGGVRTEGSVGAIGRVVVAGSAGEEVIRRLAGAGGAAVGVGAVGFDAVAELSGRLGLAMSITVNYV